MTLSNTKESNDVKLSFFISYSRGDSTLVNRIVNGLKENQSSINMDVDEILPAEEWRQRIDELIYSSDIVLAILSKNSISSEECNKEIQIAEKYRKQIVPVVIAKDFNDKDVPKYISKFNYLSCIENDYEEIYKKIQDILITDIPAIREHTRILTLARQWESFEKDESRLLRGQSLAQAEKALLRFHTIGLTTELLLEFIDQSKLFQDREIKNRHHVEERSKITQSRYLSERIRSFINESDGKIQGNFIDIMDGWDKSGTKVNSSHDEECSWLFASAILTLEEANDLIGKEVTEVNICNSGERLLTISSDHIIRVFDITSHHQLCEIKSESEHHFPNGVSFSYDGNYIITKPHPIDLKYNNASLKLWCSSTGKVANEFKYDWGNDEIFKVFLSTDSNYLITLSGNGAYDKFGEGDAILWNAQTGELIKFIAEGVLDITFASDKNFFLTKMLYLDRTRKWTLKNGEEVEFEEWAAECESKGIKAKDKGDYDLISKKDNSLIATIDSYLLRSIRFSPDGKQIVAQYIHELRILNAETGALISKHNKLS